MKKRIVTLFVALIVFLTPALALARQYIIPDSDTRQLTEQELWRWDYESLGFILNEIFARYGYNFIEGEQYDQYFSRLSWYTPNANPDNQKACYPQLSKVEWDNEQLVKDVREAMRTAKNYNTDGQNYLDYITFDDPGYGMVFASKSFKANQKFSVYSAPSASSYRGANGKASVSTNGPVEVAGQENGWLLVMYDTNSGAVRVGYIRKSEINGSVSAAELDFAYTTKTCSRSVWLTDDPVTSSTDIVMLASGQRVTYLAPYYAGGSWAYVETQVNGQTVRGFIPESAID